MNRVNCRIALYGGRWKRELSKEVVEMTIRRAVHGDCSLVELEFVEPDEDVAFEVELVVITDWSDEENVRDKIIERLLERLDPEYESMVEVDIWS